MDPTLIWQVRPNVRKTCEQLVHACGKGSLYMHAEDAGAGFDAAFAQVAAQFAMPTAS